MEPREAVEKLKQIRRWYEMGGISMKMANSMGEVYVNSLNKYYTEKAKQYGVGGVKIRNNVKFWPY